MAVTVNNTHYHEGHPQALFLRYLLPVKKHLYNFIRKSSNFSSEGDDMFQETLLKGFRYFHSFDQKKDFKTWIFTIAHNVMKDAFAAQKRLNPSISLEEAGEIAAVECSDVREIYAAAAALKNRHREVFFLYYYNEFKISEIMAITGLSRPNIKFILHRARKTIKNILEVPNENGKKV